MTRVGSVVPGLTTCRSLAPLLAAIGVVASGSGCGGGLPLLHPAQTLGEGEARAAAGFSETVATGSLAASLANAQAESSVQAGTSPGGTLPTDATYARGALVAASVASGLAPLVGARVGTGAHVEVGLAYTGRSVRADVRRSFDLTDRVALSIGAGGTAALAGRQDGSALPNVDLGRVHGWGADVPLLLGYSSEAGLYSLWLGARGGWEHIDGGDVGTDAAIGPIAIEAARAWGGGLVGLAVGFRHVHVAMELDVCYASVAGEYAGTHAEVAGWTLAPAAALWWEF
jgi:hypothetical protein